MPDRAHLRKRLAQNELRGLPLREGEMGSEERKPAAGEVEKRSSGSEGKAPKKPTAAEGPTMKLSQVLRTPNRKKPE